ncbi:hypothetical protein BpHYR1_017465, partial [Brachionus plicatilis]
MYCINALKCRISAQKALELMKTADDTQSVCSDKDDNDFNDNDEIESEFDDDDSVEFVGDVYNEEEDEEDEVEMHIEEAIEATIHVISHPVGIVCMKWSLVEKKYRFWSGFINPTVLN